VTVEASTIPKSLHRMCDSHFKLSVVKRKEETISYVAAKRFFVTEHTVACESLTKRTIIKGSRLKPSAFRGSKKENLNATGKNVLEFLL
jgi:hypothetical protein